MRIKIDNLKAPLFLAWQINSECNLECLHCCEEAGDIIVEKMKEEEIYNFLQQIIELRIPYVAISGGEPLIHPNFKEICEYLSKNGVNLKVETNGEYIDEETAKWFSDLKFRSVQLSLDGVEPSSHEKLRKYGNWHKTVSACEFLIKYKVNTEIVFVPTRFNIHQIGDLIDFAYKLGVYGVYTGKLMRIGRAAINWEIISPTEEQYKEFFKVLEEKMKQYDKKMKIFYYPFDVIEELKYRLRYPAASLLILPDGRVKLIGPLPFICGDLKKETITSVWEKYKKGWKNKRVIEFTKKVINDPKLLSLSNKWIEL